MTKREELESALANVEAALIGVVTNSGGFRRSDWAEVDSNIEKHRACCRRARAALVEMNRSPSTEELDNSADVLIEQLQSVDKQSAAHSSFQRKISRQRNNGERSDSRGAVVSGRVDSNDVYSETTPPRERRGAAIRRRLPLRQSLNLLALVIAYLQYYFIDVYLQIVGLPSVFG